MAPDVVHAHGRLDPAALTRLHSAGLMTPSEDQTEAPAKWFAVRADGPARADLLEAARAALGPGFEVEPVRPPRRSRPPPRPPRRGAVGH